MSVTEQYSINELEKFNRVYRGTQLSRLIEFTDDAILSTVIRSKIHVDVEPVFDIVHRYEINIRVPVVPGTLTSDVFYSRIHTDRTTEQLYDLYLDDDGAGNVRLYRIENTLITYIDDKLGTIDYSNGIITIPKLSVYNYNTEFLSIKATPSVDDIAGINNNVISLDIEHMAVSVIADE